MIAPQRELDWARKGAAYVSGALAGLSDEELSAPSLLPGWTRAHVIAHLGYNAKALSRLVTWARTGVETPMYGSLDQRNAEIASGADLPAQQLRGLFTEAEAQLDADWTGVTEEQWANEVRTIQGRTVPLSETAWMRTREVWAHGIDLSTEAITYADVPADLLDELAADVLRSWARRDEQIDLVVAPTDRPERIVVGSAEGAPVVSGPMADLVGWLTGRRDDGLSVGGRPAGASTDLPTIPRWF
ncbi:maleylpyruvate isomerase family mycothiol-dependent enzyme [Raineyella sp. W15-4]|uniref:maleylpyruvate isomerase family mycothiol-dependent enzyme n=1 Tax=Raineyella sp. W15-4 TaxID=3081651 RepID=UPI0029532645|nr:maleylpyruvate isomerase family mycothiol-dependent enzyme [Raineyella sp. W15-4]WOQ17904.1 maleylpyruvate isomerase family mycothiol-dependent enzyme [Raineyella sp. W15-4]